MQYPREYLQTCNAEAKIAKTDYSISNNSKKLLPSSITHQVTITEQLNIKLLSLFRPHSRGLHSNSFASASGQQV